MKRRSRLLVALGMAMVIFTGCGNQNSSSPESDASQEEGREVPSGSEPDPVQASEDVG